jgi:hypothetical protein
MERCLGRDVFESQHLIVLVHDRRRHVPVGNFAKQTVVGHERALLGSASAESITGAVTWP